jgi:hypothetical protein
LLKYVPSSVAMKQCGLPPCPTHDVSWGFRASLCLRKKQSGASVCRKGKDLKLGEDNMVLLLILVSGTYGGAEKKKVCPI